jgi:hypothetical protein
VKPSPWHVTCHGDLVGPARRRCGRDRDSPLFPAAECLRNKCQRALILHRVKSHPVTAKRSPKNRRGVIQVFGAARTGPLPSQCASSSSSLRRQRTSEGPGALRDSEAGNTAVTTGSTSGLAGLHGPRKVNRDSEHESESLLESVVNQSLRRQSAWLLPRPGGGVDCRRADSRGGTIPQHALLIGMASRLIPS